MDKIISKTRRGPAQLSCCRFPTASRSGRSFFPECPANAVVGYVGLLRSASLAPRVSCKTLLQVGSAGCTDVQAGRGGLELSPTHPAAGGVKALLAAPSFCRLLEISPTSPWHSSRRSCFRVTQRRKRSAPGGTRASRVVSSSGPGRPPPFLSFVHSPLNG